MDVKDLTLAHVKSHLQVEFRPSSSFFNSAFYRAIPSLILSVFLLHLFLFLLGLMYKEVKS